MKKYYIVIVVLIVMIAKAQSQDFTIGRLNGASGLAICSGENVTFQAAISATSYRWYINGNNVYTDHPEIPQAQVLAKDNWGYAVGSTIYCVAETPSGSKTSNTLTTTTCVPPVLPTFTVGIDILPARGAKIYCATENVTFEAKPSHSWSTILWYKRECSSCETLNVGGGLTYDPSTLDDDDLISVVAYPSSPSNFQNSSATSFVPVDILVIRGPVSISAFVCTNLPSLERCQGSGQATNFSASIVDFDVVTWAIQNVENPSGPAPGTITWNAASPQTASVSWASEFVGNARITVSSTGCGGVAGAPPITIFVKPSSPSPTLTLSGPGFVCPGNGATFLTNGTNAGSDPSYWFTVNGTNTTSTDDGNPFTPLPPPYTLALQSWNWTNGVPVKAFVENRDQCVSGNRIAESNTIVVYSSINDLVTINSPSSRCQGTGSTQFTLTTNGNIQTSFVWSLTGAGAGSSITQNGLVNWDPSKYGDAYVSVWPTGCPAASLAKPYSILQAPPTIGSQNIQACNWEYLTLQSNSPTNVANWYKNSVLISSENSLPVGIIYEPGVYTYEVESLSNTGCKSLSKASIQISIRDNNCDDNLNWVETKVLGANGLPIAHSKEYFDLTGVALQSQVKGFQSGKVLVNQSIKDRYGRIVGSTLAAPSTSGNFSYNLKFAWSIHNRPFGYRDVDDPNNIATVLNPIPISDQIPGTLGWYYSANNTMERNVPVTNYPYSRNEFYEDGSEQVRRSASPGNAHRLGAGHEILSGSFPVFNELNDYLAKRVIALPNIIQDGGLKNEALQNIVRDENGKFGISITDKSGKTILSCRAGTQNDNVLIINNTISSSGNPASSNYRPMTYFYLLEEQPVTITGSGDFVAENLVTNEKKAPGVTFAQGNGKWPSGFYRILLSSISSEISVNYLNYFLDVSYQFYDDAGRLKAFISPNGYKAWKLGTAYQWIDKTNYEYNHQGWLLNQTEPDAGTSRYVYRSDGKIRFSQNAEQLTKNRFSYTHYDRLGRSVESGEYTGTGVSFVSMNSPSFASSDMNLLLEKRDDEISWSNGVKTDWVRTYYDFPVTRDSNLPEEYVQDYVRGSVSCTENSNTKTWYSYDEFGHIAWMAQKPIAMNRVFVTKYTYDFTGNVLTVKNLCYVNQAIHNPFTFYHHYQYDADQRLSKVLTSLDGTTTKLRATYEYYLHGPLKRIELGDNIQGIDFVYNIKGWLTQINHPDKSLDPGGDLNDVFGMVLDYYESALQGIFQSTDIRSFNSPNEYHNIPKLDGVVAPNALSYQFPVLFLKDHLRLNIKHLKESLDSENNKMVKGG